MSTTIFNKLEAAALKRMVDLNPHSQKALAIKDGIDKLSSPLKKPMTKQCSEINSYFTHGSSSVKLPQRFASKEVGKLNAKKMESSKVLSTKFLTNPDDKFSDQPLSKLKNANRTDFNGNPILKNGKNHKIVFVDEISNAAIEDVVLVKRIYYENEIVSYRDSQLPLIKERTLYPNSKPNSSGSCSCLCVIY